jgi:YidC/Oxa1 family membrane protein insertase
MEKRVLLAIILSLAVLLIWQALFPPPKPEKMPEIPSGEQLKDQPLSQKPVPPPAEKEPRKEVAQNLTPPQTDRSALPPEKEIVITTDLYRATFSSHGACLKRFELFRYKNRRNLPGICFVFPFTLLYGDEQIYQDDSYKELIGNNLTGSCPLQILVNGREELSQPLVFTEDLEFLELDSSNEQGTVSFTWKSPEGVVLTKQFTFFNDNYFIDCGFSLENNSSLPVDLKPAVRWPQGVRPEAQQKSGGFFGGFGGDIQQFSYLLGDTLNRTEVKDIEENKVFSGDIKWSGFEEKYFLSALIPHEAEGLKLKLFEPQNDEVSFHLGFPPATLSPQNQYTFPSSVYIGPKDLNYLEKGRGELGRVVSFGFFDPVAKPMLLILNLFYAFIPNYGLAIIFLSVGIKLIFWPLTHKSQKSMKEMQKIQPKIAELKEKYKNNKEELNRKTMEFYRANKVNPLGGCLPILIQIPVFFALYRVLLNSIELRHASFISFWINDLAAKDPTYVSPLLMVASMFLQQKMTPTVGDPAQAKIMLVMPIMFTFMFLSFPSGLVIYWLVSNVLSIVQQYYINKQSS